MLYNSCPFLAVHKKKLMKKVQHVCKRARCVFTSSSLSMIKQIFLSPVLSVFSVEAFSFVFSPFFSDSSVFFSVSVLSASFVSSVVLVSFEVYKTNENTLHYVDVAHVGLADNDNCFFAKTFVLVDQSF